PSRRAGRMVLYSDAHLARLRLIGELLERGYTLANISELVTAWETGQDVGALLGLEAALGGAWGERSQVTVTTGELAATFGAQAAAMLEEAIEAGLLAEEGEGRYRVLNPAALEIGALLTSSGVPLEAVIAAARSLRDDVDTIARRFVDLVEAHVFDPVGEPPPPGEAQRLAQLVEHLRPLVSQVVETELARAMERQVQRRLGEHLHRFAQSLATSQRVGTSRDGPPVADLR
ncbi:MAG: MerR family transcriptional regulator, partial [Solirubrobacteraceae bacterium]